MRDNKIKGSLLPSNQLNRKAVPPSRGIKMNKVIADLDSEDETKTLRQGINSKVLILGKLQDYELQSKGKQLKEEHKDLQAKSAMGTISAMNAYVNRSERKNIIYKQPKKNLTQNRSIDLTKAGTSTDKLLPPTRLIKRNASQAYQENAVYLKKHVSIENHSSDKRIIALLDAPSSSIKNNPLHDLYEKKRTRNQSFDSNLAHFNALKIQAHWRGFYSRKSLFEKMTQYTIIYRLIASLSKAFIVKAKANAFQHLKAVYLSLKLPSLTKANNLSKKAIIYSKNKMASSLKREHNEEMELLGMQRGWNRQCVCSQVVNEEIKGYEEAKHRERLLKQLLIFKLKQGRRSLKSCFYQLFIGGMIGLVKEEKEKLRRMNQGVAMKKLFLNMVSIEHQRVRKAFLRLYFIQVLFQIKDHNNQAFQGSENPSVRKEEEEKVGNASISNKATPMELNESSIGVVKEVDPIFYKNLKMRRLVFKKEDKFIAFFQRKFLRLYYKGVLIFFSTSYKAPIPSQSIEEGKVTESTTVIPEPEVKVEDTLTFPQESIKKIEKHFEDDEEIIPKVERKEKKAMSTKENRPNLRNKIHMKKTQNTSNSFNALYTLHFIKSLIRAMNQTAAIIEQSKSVFSNEITLDDAPIEKSSIERVKAGIQIVQEERRRKLKHMVALIEKSHQAVLKQALTVYSLALKVIALYELRESKLLQLLNKREADLFNVLKNYFNKMNLTTKLARLKEIHKSQKRRSKTKKLSQSTRLNSPYSQMEYMREGSIEEINDLDDNDNDNTGPKSVKKKKSLFFANESMTPSQSQQSTWTTDSQPTTIMKHIKLHSVISTISKKTLRLFFNMWNAKEEERNVELEQYMASCLLINIFTKAEKRFMQSLKVFLVKWEKAGIILMKRDKKTMDTIALKSFAIAGNSIQLFFINRRKRHFLHRLYRRLHWDDPLNTEFTQGEMVFKLRKGKEETLIRNERLLRNWLWKYQMPLKYYFFKYCSKVYYLKMRELELLKVS